MKKNEILGVLKEAGEPVSIEKLSDETGILVTSLRLDLHRLQKEGEVENVEQKSGSWWKVKRAPTAKEK